MKPKVYAYAGCDTCRNALKFLREHGIEFQLIPIREQPPTIIELKRMLAIYAGNLRKLFNTSGSDYKQLNLKEKLPRMSVDAALELLSRNGNLVKRPFLLTDKAGVVGFKSEEWGETLRMNKNFMKRALLILSSLSICLPLWSADNWPQFRGPGGLSLAAPGDYPLHFGPESNVLWKVALPSGNSSPCVWGDRIFLTALHQNRLETLCLDRRDGKILWRNAAPAEKLEPTHRLGNPATPTPATDGERVYVSFGSYGIIAYDFQGNEVWKHPLPQPIIEFGTSSSPVVADGLVILNCDQDVGSMLRAFDARTGKVAWQTSRDFFLRGFATPLVWRHDETTELVVPGSVVLSSYNLKDGKERWSYRGTSRVATASPVAGGGLLFSSSWNVGGDEGERVSMPKFNDVASEYDKNKDGNFTLNEIPAGPVRERFSQIDVNKDGVVTPAEWDAMAAIFARAENAVLAIKPGGRGDITASHLAWKENKQLPYVSSPLYYEGRLYTVRSGGLVSCYDAKSGRPHYQGERLGAAGDYYSSAVGASGRVYFISQGGVVTVIQSGDELKVLASHPLNEEVMPTPAFVDGKIYLRTAKWLYAFGR